MRKGMTLEFKVTQQEITRLDSQKVYERTKGYLYAHFVFSDDWEGYLKTVKFSNLLDNSYIGVTLASDNTCMVPYTLILYPGVTFCIEGTKDGDVITTNDFVFDVDESNSTVIETDQPIYEIESKTLDYEKNGITATLNVNSEVLEEVDNTIEITSEDITIEDDKIVFNSDVAHEIMSMNKRIKVDASIVDPILEQGTYVGIFTPRGVIDYSLPDGTIVYEYSTTNWLLDCYRTTYVKFLWDATTEKLYLNTDTPAYYEDHIVGFWTGAMGNISLTSDTDLSASSISTLRINDLDTISFDNNPSLEFNANENNELESIAFKQNGYSSDFTYTVPKGAKHYVVNELPTTDIDATGNYYVMTESEDARGYLSTDIRNLTTTEFPVRMGGESRSDAVVNTTSYTALPNTLTSVGEYRGSIAIKFNIPCTVTVTLNPRPTGSGSGRFGFMNLYKNNYNNHLMLTNAGEIGIQTLNFNKDEILCIDCSGYSNQYYYKLAIQPYTINGKIPLSTNVDEYINFENIWFKNGGNGGNPLYRHHLTITTYGQPASVDFDVISTKSEPYTTTTLRNLGTIICDNVPRLETVTNGYRLTYFTKITISSNDNFIFTMYYLTFNNDNTITESSNSGIQYLLKTVTDNVTEV